jgi:hypothetical protein
MELIQERCCEKIGNGAKSCLPNALEQNPYRKRRRAIFPVAGRGKFVHNLGTINKGKSASALLKACLSF